MKITYSLSKYLIFSFMKWFIITSGAVGFIFSLFDIMELFRRTSGKAEIGISLVLKIFLFRFPSYFQEILPFVLFFAAIISFWRLNRNQELLIIRASGVSIWQILAPLGAVALLIGLTDLLVLNSFSAKLLEKANNLENKYIHQQNTPFSISKSGFWLREIVEDRQVILHATHFDQKAQTLYNVNAYIFDEDDRFIERLDAKQGHLKGEFLNLSHGWHLQKDGFPKHFKAYHLTTNLSVQSIQDSFLDPKTLTFYTLRSYGKLLETSGLSATQYFMQWHSLLARCLWLVVMVLLAATFSMAPMRYGGTMRLIVGGIAVTFLLYFLRDITYALGSSGNLPPLLAAWVPTLVTAFFATTKLLYSEDG